jgi:FMN phosphatase YigB (HAD superfamily)
MPFISTCLCSFELGLEKPDPAIFKLALDGLCGVPSGVYR